MSISPSSQNTPPANLMQRAYQELRDAIISGAIPSGTLLSEQQIARQLNVSRTPVREALAILEDQGLVEVRRGVGAFVRPLSYQDICHIFEVRLSLEVLAVRSALYHITPADIQELRESFLDLLDRYENHREVSPQEFTQMDFRLHDLIVDRCENPYVRRFMATVHANVKRLQVLSCSRLGDRRESTQQHLELLQLLEQRNLPALEEALRKHITWSFQCFRREDGLSPIP